MKNVLTFSRVQISLFKRVLLHDLNFNVAKGSVTAVVGSNGVGKSSLLKAIVGIDGVSHSGDLFLQNRALTSTLLNERARIVGYLPQNPTILFSYSVTQFIEMSFYAHGNFGSEERSKVATVLRELNIGHLKDRDLSSLSGGEIQKVLFAAAIVHEPQILLLDEPTAALDPFHEGLVEELINRVVRERNMAVVLVTHALNLVASVANQIVALREGAVIYCGESRAFFTTDIVETVYGSKCLIMEHPERKIPIVVAR
jgi:iron complex transport system ATP-binding protein